MAGICTFGIIESASAAISQQWNQDAAGLGDSQAGSAASALDASTEFYNPAGLIMMKEQQVVFGANLYAPTQDFNRTYQSGGSTSEADSSGGVFSYSPFLHYAAPISEQWAFGFGVSSPFAAHTDWATDTHVEGVGDRHASMNQDFSTYDVSFDLAYALTKKFSLGIGLDMMRVIYSEEDTKASNSNGYDAYLSGTQWNRGWHGGMMYQLTPAARMGLAYHSKVEYEASGAANTVSAEGAVLQSTNDFVLSSTLPAYTTGSVYVELDPRLALEGSVSYTQWDAADQVTYQNLPNTTTVIPEKNVDYNLNNTWRTAFGAHYTLTSEVMLRGGIGYETSPYANDATTIYLAAPEGGSYDVSAGIQYQYSKTLAFDFGWTHIFYVTQDVQSTANNGNTTTGEFSGSNDILGAQVRWDML